MKQQLIESIQTKNSLEDIFECIYERLQSVVPHSRLGLALFDDKTGKLVQVKTRSRCGIYLDDGYAADISGSTLEKILYSGEVRIIGDLEKHFVKRPSHWTGLILKESLNSSLTLPLKLNDRPIGIIFFTHKRKNAFTEKHIEFLTEIVGQLAIAIEKGKWISDLAESQERYRLLFEMSHDGIFICASIDNEFLSFNNNFRQWLGYEYEELFSMSLQSLTDCNLQKVLFNSTSNLELKNKSSGIIYLEVYFTKIKYKGRDLIQGVAKNVTEVITLQKQLQQRDNFFNIIGKNYQMQQIFQTIDQLRNMSTTVLIGGENGTGKELVAKAIHASSGRNKSAFVAINCGAISENLIESELFGHVKGAFTGATHLRQGRFEIADGGTLFLDEVGELALNLQVKLLRVLQEGEFQKLGSSQTQKVDVRLIAATNQNLEELISVGKFRQDLYYRLNVIGVYVPPLRERRDDIPLLVKHFINKYRQKTGKDIISITTEALNMLLDYHFPGNIRELENIIEHAFVKCSADSIERHHLPSYLLSVEMDIITTALRDDAPLQRLEKELIQHLMAKYNGKTSIVAKKLGVSRTTLWRKLNK
ncbi:sigma 54-interacting transcriptional regulator [Candidatus Uabimicrobium sp. HlEnr_7]|uniref:sigma-54-dependent Fis family transcriptional regulator n=1 Tax=Candidatus Uabimicrobium helgolandensis TaxID=3095367 RepID=UPI0035574CF1